MIRIAIVGEIGSGKTIVAKILKLPTFYADIEVAEIYQKDKRCYKKLKKRFPKFIKSFPIKKKEIVEAILNNRSNIRKISKIIHPIVRKRLKKFLSDNGKNKYVVLDIPLYFENNIYKKKDIVIFVQSNKKNIQKRIIKRKFFNMKLTKYFRSIQKKNIYKKKKSQFIIENNSNKMDLRKKVNIIKNKILNERNST